MAVEFLYKYGRLTEYSEALFTTPTIWFSAPAQLNDPFECRPCLTFEGTPEQIVESLTRSLERRHPEFTHETAKAHAVSMFLERSQKAPNWEQMRQDMAARFAQRIGLYCLSKVNDSILMWSHYSQEHRGYCLQFGATDYTPVFGRAQEVRYATDFPVVDVFNTPIEDQANLIFLTKYIGWSYEKEWRIIDHQDGPGLREYPPELLRGVIFGLRMPAADRAKISSWLEKRGHPVRLFETVQHERQFAIVVREIDA